MTPVCADTQGTHRVSYDDGDVQDEDLLHGDYRILDGQDSHVRPGTHPGPRT